MVPSFHASHFPAGQEVGPRGRPVTNAPPALDATRPPTVNEPGVGDLPESSNDPSDPCTPTPTDHSVPSSALNNLQLRTTQTSAPSPTLISTPGLPVTPTSVTLSTSTVLSIQGGSLSTGSSSNRKYIIGGAVGGSVLALILLTLLIFCCRKRRGQKGLERSGGNRSEGRHVQFACCNHGARNRHGEQTQMEQKTSLKPFVLKSDPKGRPQGHSVSLNRRDSAESQKSGGSVTSTETLCSPDSEGFQRGTRKSRRRPPPLKLTSLVTPIVSGPRNNLRRGVDRPSPPGPHGIPTIVVDPPQPVTLDRTRRR